MILTETQVEIRESRSRYVQKSGVTLAFHGAQVCLRMVDLVGLDGAPGDGAGCDPARAFYLVAPNETWSVSKDGVVSIAKK